MNNHKIVLELTRMEARAVSAAVMAQAAPFATDEYVRTMGTIAGPTIFNAAFGEMTDNESQAFVKKMLELTNNLEAITRDELLKEAKARS